MSDTNLEQEIELIIKTAEEAQEIRQTTGAPVVDPQADNMTRVADLLVKGMRDATAETAKRILEVNQSIVREALASEQADKEFTERLIAHTEQKAAEFMDFFQRRRNAILGLTQIKDALALPDEKPKQ